MEQDKIATELDESKELQQEEIQIETEIERAKKKRREAIFEMSLFFILGLLIGITLKTEAVKRITMGFNDYQIKKTTQSYDVTQIKKNLDDQQVQAEMQQQAQQQQIQK